MEAIYGENWELAVIFSLIITWGIGLAPPLLLRFVFFRRQFEKWWAIATVSILWLFNMVLFISLGSQSKTHIALTLVAFVSFYILRKEAKEKPALKEEVLPKTTADYEHIIEPKIEKTEIKTASGNWFVNILRNVKQRWLVSLLPFVVLILFEVFNNFDRFLRDLNRNPEIFLYIFAGFTVFSWVVLTVFLKIIQNWKDSFVVRLFTFGSFVWIISVLLFIVVVEPYGSRMSSNEFGQMYLMMFVPPTFISAATFVYKRFIET